MSRFSTLACLLAPALASPAAGQLDTSGHRLRRSIEIPALGRPEEIVRVPIPVEVIASARPGLADLRISDEAGIEIRYYVSILGPEERRREVRAELLNLGLGPAGEIRFEIRVAEATAPHNRFSLSIEGGEFVRRVRVETADPGGRRLTLVEDAKIFRLELGSTVSEQLEVAYPDSTSRTLTVSLVPALVPETQDRAEIRVRGARVEHLVTSEAFDEQLDVHITERAIEGKKDTEVLMELPHPNIPIHRMEWDVSGENFSRRVDLFGAAGTEPERWTQLGQAQIYRFTLAEEKEEKTTFDLTGQARRYRAVLVNEDNPPLTVRRARAVFHRREVWFPARVRGQYWLYYGGPDTTMRPSYDIGALVAGLDRRELPEARLLAEEPNPLHSGPRPPFTERYPLLLWGALILMVAVLGGLILRSLRQASLR